MGRSRQLVLHAAVYGGLSLYFLKPILETGSSLGMDDWDALLFQHASVLKSALEYGRLPFWNPWYCGGNVLWQNPQAPLLTPAHLIGVFTGVPLAVKITVLLHYLAGFAGMHVLLRRGLGVASNLYVWFIAAMFTLGGGAALHVAVGHMTFLPYFYLPWVLWLFVAALSSGAFRYATGAAALLALAVWNGGVIIVVMAMVALGIFAASAALCRRDWRPIVMIGFVAALMVLASAPKLLPALIFAADPRKVDIRAFPPGPDVMSLQMLLTTFLEPFQFRRMRIGGMKYGWHEYGNYLGTVAILLAAGSVVSALTRIRERDQWLGVSLSATTVVLLLIAIGDFGALAPYSLLRLLPGISDLRIPTRYLLVFTVFAAATIGWSIGSRGNGVAARPSPQIAVVLILATAILVYCNRTLVMNVFPFTPPAQKLTIGARSPAPAIDAVTDGFALDSPMLRALLDNRAVLQCNEPLQLPGNVDPGRPVIFSDGDAAISRLRFDPSRIEFGVTTRNAPARVFMNQRYVAGWSSTAGPVGIDPATQLPYVTIPPMAAGTYAFSFVPKGLAAGLAALVMGLVVAAATWRRRL
jgi:hypothetical protein